MLEKIVAALESIAASLVIIATSLKDAALKATPGAAPVAAAAAAAPAPPAPAPAAAPAAAAAATGPTKEEVQTKARLFSDAHGRDEIKKVMVAAGVKNMKEIKPEQIKPMFDALVAAEAAKGGAGAAATADDDLGL